MSLFLSKPTYKVFYKYMDTNSSERPSSFPLTLLGSQIFSKECVVLLMPGKPSYLCEHCLSENIINSQ